MIGKKDRGFFAHTQTFKCNTCVELIDVAVSESEWQTEQWKTHYCKKCNNLLEVWDTKKKMCPNCGIGKLIVCEGDFIFWD